MKNKKGFTLSEVLITLTIIGVISSLVIPSLISNTDVTKKSIISKKAYNTISVAYSEAINNSRTDILNKQNLIDELTKHLNVKYYWTQSEAGVVTSAPGEKTNVNNATGAELATTTGFDNFTNWIVTEDGISYAIAQTSDGDHKCEANKINLNTGEALNRLTNSCYVVAIDIDGPKKGDHSNVLLTLNNNKITNFNNDLLYVYITKAGVSAGNFLWLSDETEDKRTFGSMAAILEAED